MKRSTPNHNASFWSPPRGAVLLVVFAGLLSSFSQFSANCMTFNARYTRFPFNINLSHSSSIILQSISPSLCAFGQLSSNLILHTLALTYVFVRSRSVLRQSFRNLDARISLSRASLWPHIRPISFSSSKDIEFGRWRHLFCFRAISQDPLHLVLLYFDAEIYSILPFQRA